MGPVRCSACAEKSLLSSGLGLWIFGVPIAGFSDLRVCSRSLGDAGNECRRCRGGLALQMLLR